MTQPKVLLETDKGSITLALYPEQAPKTVANFLASVDAGFYDGTIFHRVIENFMVQGGGMTADMQEKQAPNEPVANEAASGLSNERGTIAMARTMDPHSATVQFFINTVDNGRLDYTSDTIHGYGYCAFGRVIDGMDVVDAIEGVATTTRGMHANVPENPILIITAKRA